MSSYQRIPTSEDAAAEAEQELSLENPHTRATLREFEQPAPAWWKRAALVFTIIFLAWIAIRLGRGATSKSSPEIIYATR